MSDLRLRADWDKAYEEAGGKVSVLAEQQGLAQPTLYHWKKHHQQGHVWDGEQWVIPDDNSEPTPTISDVDRLRAAHEKREHRVHTQEAARTEIILEHVLEAVRSLPPVKIKPPYFAATGKRRSPMAQVCHLGDFHYGETVDPEEVMALNAYDPEIAARRLFRYETLIFTALDIIGRSHPVPELRILMVGDMVSGAIHNEIAESNEYDLYEQWANLSLLLSQFVMRVASRYERVVIEGVPGNHGRFTQKPTAKGKYVNWDYLMYQTMSLMLANQPNVTCNFPRSPILTTSIEGHSFLVWHGDSVRSWAGIPFYGVQRAIARLMEIMQAKEQTFEYAALGHFHTGAELQRAIGKVLMNPSLKGGDEYSVNNLFSYSPPSQLLYFMHREHGITWQLDNDLSHGDGTEHPYILAGGDCLADSWREAQGAVA